MHSLIMWSQQKKKWRKKVAKLKQRLEGEKGKDNSHKIAKYNKLVLFSC